MRKYILGTILMGILGLVFIAHAAPTSTFSRTLLPEITNTYDLGSSGNTWRSLYTNQICLTGDCKTAWPTGGSGGATTTINGLTPSNGTFTFKSGNPSVVVGTVSPSTITLTVATTTIQGLITGTSPINVASGVVSLQSSLGANNYFTSGFINASTTISTSATTTNLAVLTAASIPALSNLISNGFVKTGSSNGTLSVDTNTYLTGVTADAPLGGAGTAGSHLTCTGCLTGNQTITLSGDVTGSGATAITATIGTGRVTNLMLQNSYIGVSAGNGLTGGGATALGATSTLSIGTHVWTTNLEATTSNFTNLNASSTILTNATTTGQSFFPGSVWLTNLTGQSCLGTSAAGLLQAGTCSGGSTLATSTVQDMFHGGSFNIWTSGFINSSSSRVTNATTSSLFISGVTAGSLLAVDSNGMVIATTTSAGGVTAVNATAPITTTGGSSPTIGLQSNFGSMNVWTSGFLNATSSQFTNSTTTGQAYFGSNTYFTGLTGQNCLGTSAAGLLQAGSCGASTGNAAWTIGNGVIYNATSTDLVGIGTSSPTTTLFVQGKGGTNPFTVASSTGTALLTIDQGGNVGIGIVTPQALLEVNGNSLMDGSLTFYPFAANITVAATTTAGANGTSLTITSGLGNGTSTSGDLNLIAADGPVLNNVNGNGGNVLVEAGSARGPNSNGGNLTLESGAGNGTGTPGNIIFAPGQNNNSTQVTGAVILSGGLGAGGTGGQAIIRGGNSLLGAGGDLLLYGGSGATVFGNKNGGNIYLQTSTPGGSGVAGKILFNDHNTSTIITILDDHTIGINSSTPGAIMAIEATTSKATLPILIVASSSNASFFQVNANGSVLLPQLTSQNCIGTDSSGVLQAGTCGSSSQSTSTIQSMFQGGSWNQWTSGFSNASTSIMTSATTTNFGITGITGKLLATDPNGVVISTSSPIFTLANGTNTTAASNAINLNSNVLGVTLFAGTTMNASTANFTTLNASSSILTNATTTGQQFLKGITGGFLLSTDPNGMVIATTTIYQPVLTNPVTGTGVANQVPYWSGTTAQSGAANFAWINGSNVLAINGTLNATSSVFTSATTTNLTISGFTAGSVLFTGGGGAINQANASLFWDNTNKLLGVSSGTPGSTLAVQSQSAQTRPILIVATSTGASVFQITPSGDVKITGVATSSTAFLLQNPAGQTVLQADETVTNPGLTIGTTTTSSLYNMAQLVIVGNPIASTTSPYIRIASSSSVTVFGVYAGATSTTQIQKCLKMLATDGTTAIYITVSPTGTITGSTSKCSPEQ